MGIREAFILASAAAAALALWSNRAAIEEAIRRGPWNGGGGPGGVGPAPAADPFLHWRRRRKAAD